MAALTIFWDDLSVETALDFCEYLVRSEDYKLRDLAIWIQGSGGPIDELDGSIGSLVALWSWFKSFREQGLPGVPLGARAAYSVITGRPLDSPLEEGSRLVGESVAHYVFKVILSLDPTAHWAVRAKSGRIAHAWDNTPGISMDGGKHFGPAVGFFTNYPDRLSSNYHNAYAAREAWDDTGLLQSVELLYLAGLPSRPRSTSTTESILSPLLRDDHVGSGHREEIPIAQEMPASITNNGPVSAGAEELIFASVGADVSRLDQAAPLDELAVASVLAELGFVSADGQSVSAVTLLSHGVQVQNVDGFALVETHVAGGRLRGLFLEPMRPSEKEWKSITDAFSALGEKLPAHLANER
ncbi:hypothetical protein EYE40_08695 [Glaciihabitans arcticus]|uniref:Uncharacterized protein n=1 Tax=Glaciihabitans arcticus TaxID=2668039 RepID=A0A4Q9GYQ4_9MICO|nr:hypothetical protein [Glaciihabitans arcticus]TBN57460.1 hypothetical protein EYE40_08695 [Glaciihabitans arcticus]